MDLQTKLDNLPTSPGVYLMKNDQGEIIYVGKAINLRNRVRSYFRELKPDQAKTKALVKHIVDLEYILADNELIICQSNAKADALRKSYEGAEINPIGDWTGGTDVDTGATNRKLGSDMADSVTGGGLHGKDLSKADVSVNIYAFLKAQETGEAVEFCCAIGDESVDGIPYDEIVETARAYIKSVGGFEAFAEWGLVC